MSLNIKQLRKLALEFNGYRHSVSEERIREWIDQFEKHHSEIPEIILKSINFFTHDQIAACFRSALDSLEGWDIDESKRKGQWRFVPYSTSAGESGDSMVHKFRHANNLSGRVHNSLFIARSEIPRAKLGPDDSIVLIDDFVGSGSQASGAWKSVFDELLPEVGRIYLLVVSGFIEGVDKVREETNMEIVAGHLLGRSDNVFSDHCDKFSSLQKGILLEYCKRASKKFPKGCGDCGLLVVFAHSCPNNSIAVLHGENDKWEPLFRRYN